MFFFLKLKKNVRTVETQTESETWKWEQNEVENIGWPDSTSEEVIIYEEPLTYEDQSSESVVTIQEEENPFSLTQTTEYENRSENSQTLTEDNSS
ncbi:23804_t:CDS:1, partial [Gigaspora margarita]